MARFDATVTTKAIRKIIKIVEKLDIKNFDTSLAKQSKPLLRRLKKHTKSSTNSLPSKRMYGNARTLARDTNQFIFKLTKKVPMTNQKKETLHDKAYDIGQHFEGYMDYVAEKKGYDVIKPLPAKTIKKQLKPTVTKNFEKPVKTKELRFKELLESKNIKLGKTKPKLVKQNQKSLIIQVGRQEPIRISEKRADKFGLKLEDILPLLKHSGPIGDRQNKSVVTERESKRKRKTFDKANDDTIAYTYVHQFVKELTVTQVKNLPLFKKPFNVGNDATFRSFVSKTCGEIKEKIKNPSVLKQKIAKAREKAMSFSKSTEKQATLAYLKLFASLADQVSVKKMEDTIVKETDSDNVKIPSGNIISNAFDKYIKNAKTKANLKSCSDYKEWTWPDKVFKELEGLKVESASKKKFFSFIEETLNWSKENRQKLANKPANEKKRAIVKEAVEHLESKMSNAAMLGVMYFSELNEIMKQKIEKNMTETKIGGLVFDPKKNEHFVRLKDNGTIKQYKAVPVMLYGEKGAAIQEERFKVGDILVSPGDIFPTPKEVKKITRQKKKNADIIIYHYGIKQADADIVTNGKALYRLPVANAEWRDDIGPQIKKKDVISAAKKAGLYATDLIWKEFAEQKPVFDRKTKGFYFDMTLGPDLLGEIFIKLGNYPKNIAITDIEVTEK